MRHAGRAKAITVRDIPREVAEELRRRSRQDKTSMTRTVLKILEEATGAPPEATPVAHDDLDELAGSWSREEAAEFDAALAEQRTVDPEMWK